MATREVALAAIGGVINSNAQHSVVGPLKEIWLHRGAITIDGEIIKIGSIQAIHTIHFKVEGISRLCWHVELHGHDDRSILGEYFGIEAQRGVLHHRDRSHAVHGKVVHVGFMTSHR